MLWWDYSESSPIQNTMDIKLLSECKKNKSPTSCRIFTQHTIYYSKLFISDSLHFVSAGRVDSRVLFAVPSHFLNANLILSTSCLSGGSLAFLPALLSLPHSFVPELSHLLKLRRLSVREGGNSLTPTLLGCTCELWPRQRLAFGVALKLITFGGLIAAFLHQSQGDLASLFSPRHITPGCLSFSECQAANHCVCWLWATLVCNAH